LRSSTYLSTIAATDGHIARIALLAAALSCANSAGKGSARAEKSSSAQQRAAGKGSVEVAIDQVVFLSDGQGFCPLRAAL
jgi:hypothetical protein